MTKAVRWILTASVCGALLGATALFLPAKQVQTRDASGQAMAGQYQATQVFVVKDAPTIGADSAVAPADSAAVAASTQVTTPVSEPVAEPVSVKATLASALPEASQSTDDIASTESADDMQQAPQAAETTAPAQAEEPAPRSVVSNAPAPVVGSFPTPDGQPFAQQDLFGEHSIYHIKNFNTSGPWARVLKARSALVVNAYTNEVLFAKNANVVQPIASITKLMTALVITRSGLNMNEKIRITSADVDRLKHSSSRLRVGTVLTRRTLLHLALMSSENRAAHALARTYPGGVKAFVKAMNHQAQALRMTQTHFVDPTGLNPGNVSGPVDLVKLVNAASKERLIQRFTTSDGTDVRVAGGRRIPYANTNHLVRDGRWDIKLSKTGYITESGDCLVMKAYFRNHPIIIIILHTVSGNARFADANRIRHTIERIYPSYR